MKESFINFKKTLVVTIILFVICGLAYPLIMTGLAQIFFPHQANGSLITIDGKTVGSEIIGQDFSKDYFMKCRPSAVNYNTYTEKEKTNGTYSGVGSGSQNLAPSNPKLTERVKTNIQDFLSKNPSVKKEDIPTDLMTASGSGLDPHISPKAAEIQIERISTSSNLSMEALKKIVLENTHKKALGIFGEETVNVLKVNLEIAKEMGLINSK